MFRHCQGQHFRSGCIHVLSFLRRRPVIIAYLAGAAALSVAAFFVPRDEVVLPIHAVANPAGTSISMIGELSKLIMTLNAAMLAAAGSLLLQGPDFVRAGRFEMVLTVFVFLAGAGAYFGVYYSQVRMLTMVSAGYLDPLELGLLWGIRLQYGAIIVGVFLLGLIFARMLEQRLAQSDCERLPSDPAPDVSASRD